MIKKKTTIIVAIISAVIIGGGLYLFGGNTDEFAKRIPAVEKTQFIEHSKDWRNLRYGEIIPIYRKGAKLYIEVYNTIDSNELPQELWEKIDTEKLAKEYGAMKVLYNGPRYWVVNAIDAEGNTRNGKVANFGGIEMTQRATLEKTIFERGLGASAYTENTVTRDTVYTYLKGNMVYELISPNGEIYRMQSYSQTIDKDLKIDDLEKLGDVLKLPKGWKYEARILEEDSKLDSNGAATIINDSLQNSYQKITNYRY
jgi:hypothetical protein